MLYSDEPITTYGRPPTNQNQRSLGLVLIAPDLVWEYELLARPEDLTYTHPTRATVIQTLGGAWVDDFGEGLTDIVINGHTGWRYAPDIEGAGDSQDGLQRMRDLRYYPFEAYHQARMEAAQAGISPDSIQLFFADALNQAAYLVYPLTLQVRKHKSRPLLYQYQLRLIGLMKINSDLDQIEWRSMVVV